VPRDGQRLPVQIVGLAPEQELDVGADPGDAADLDGLRIPEGPERGVLDASL